MKLEIFEMEIVPMAWMRILKKKDGCHQNEIRSLWVTMSMYGIAWRAALPLLLLSPRLKEGWGERTGLVNSPGHVDIWIQAASVGESLLAIELCERILSQTPCNILVTTNTSQGVSVLSKAPDIVPRYFPFDMPDLMRKVLSQWRPKVVVLLETELWPGLLGACKELEVPAIIVNGRLSQKSLKRYKLVRQLWQSLCPKKIMAISKEDAERFGRVFTEASIEVMNNIKFDLIKSDNTLLTNTYNKLGLNLRGHPFVVLGSVRKEEEKDILNLIKFLKQKRNDLIIGLFPRHMHRIGHWRKTLDHEKLPWLLRSRGLTGVDQGTVILWDSIGELGNAYSLASAVFVGGSLRPCGGQNFLEPLTFGLVPCVGPHWENFKWIGEDLFRLGLAVEVKNWKELGYQLLKNLLEPIPRDKVIKLATGYINARKGGASQACQEITKYLL